VRRTPEHRPSAAKRGYGRAWRDYDTGRGAADVWLAQHPLCAECERQGRVTPATCVDHVVPHRGDAEVFWHGEWQSLCAACHSRKTAAGL
jgi:5-methylcytosine-specific restriction protein A